MIPRIPTDFFESLTFFGDASSKDNEFMVAGGFAVAGKRIPEISAKIATLRAEAGIQSEFHWSAYRGGHKRRPAYEALVDYGFDLTRQGKAELHILIAQFGGYNHKANRGENRDTSVNRMYYQLCLHRLARFYGKSRQIHVRLDQGNDSEDVCKLREPICAAAFNDPDIVAAPNCIRTIESVCSQKHDIVQLADVFVGAIAANCNQRKHKTEKGDLARYVLEKSGRTTWRTSTARMARRVNVWNFRGH